MRNHEEHHDIDGNLVTSLRGHAQVQKQDAELDGTESSGCDSHEGIDNLDYGDEIIVTCVGG